MDNPLDNQNMPNFDLYEIVELIGLSMYTHLNIGDRGAVLASMRDDETDKWEYVLVGDLRGTIDGDCLKSTNKFATLEQVSEVLKNSPIITTRKYTKDEE